MFVSGSKGSLIMVGDRVLIEPEEESSETSSGLLLPASVKEKERLRGGRVVAVGPGYAIPNPEYSDEDAWMHEKSEVRYLSLQAKMGDYAYFLRKDAIELSLDGKTYLIIPHHAILALIRNQPDERDLYKG
ncbi:MAG TPA: co-chaperone GroES family protein [Rhodothermales bacterium]|nr:co-chaperone GroES family protein [Rhodothermales bacterium]HRR08871.1 co-chaperone GroES family protein [Rhodothermales bacterium]